MIRTVAKAKDREGAFLHLFPGGRGGFFPLHVDALIQRVEVVHRSLVAGRDLDEPLNEPKTDAGAEEEESNT